MEKFILIMATSILLLVGLLATLFVLGKFISKVIALLYGYLYG